MGELVLLALGVAAAWLFIAKRWHRLDRAPRRLIAFTPLVGMALVIAMFIADQAGVIIAAGAFGVELMPNDPPSIEDMGALMLGSVVGRCTVVGAYIYLLLNARKHLQDNRMKPLAAAVFGAGALALVWPVVNLVSWAASRIAALKMEQIDPVAHDTLALLVESEPSGWYFALLLLVIAAVPILEEVLYRGIIQESLTLAGMGRWSSILITSVIFTAMHAQVARPWAMAGLFVLSLGFGWAYEKSGRLTAPIVMHVLFNGGNVMLALMIA